MVHDSTNEVPWGLRRRHSAPHEEEAGQRRHEPETDNVMSGLPRYTRRAITDVDDALPVSSITESNTPASTTPRVRFSVDVDRRPSASEHITSLPGNPHIPPRSGSRTASFSKRLSWRTPLSPKRRPRVPNLSLNIAEVGASSSMVEESTVNSAGSIRSPESPAKLRPTSPRSLSARERADSLRRSLFNRSIHARVNTPGPVTEVQDPGPSNSGGYSADSTKLWNAKKTDGVQVTASPVFEDIELLAHPITKDKRHRNTERAPPSQFEQWIKRKATLRTVLSGLTHTYHNARRFILRINEIPPTKDGRHIDLSAMSKESLIDERTGKAYIGNAIRSSRYNLWNFVPRQLVFQFSKLANFYFLCVSILQMIPGLSTTGNYTTILPLCFFVSLSIAKEGYDDFRRYRLDKEENNRVSSVLHAYQPVEAGSIHESIHTPSLGPRLWAPTKWRNVKVGDIVKLERDQAAPADLVLLSSGGENGVAYIDTMALDGETNLKSKQTAPCLSKACDTVEKLAMCKAHIIVEDPNLDLYNFEGRVTVANETSPLSNTEVIYRGSILRNTPNAIGIVIYSGEESKIRMNASKNPRTKAPSLQAVVNKIVVFIVIFVIALALWNTIAYELWAEANTSDTDAWYIAGASVPFGQILASFAIMFNGMIPLSLYVDLEIIKLVQMILLNDIDMYDPVSDTPMEARTSTINEELGQVSYIFSDKTGTLTDNSMKFRKMSVAGSAWLHDQDLVPSMTSIPRLRKKRSKGKKPAKKRTSISHSLVRSGTVNSQDNADLCRVGSETGSAPRRWKSSARPTKAQPEMSTFEMLRYIQRKPHTIFARKTRFFLLCLALCHTCLPEKRADGTINFQAASPDELALVQAAQDLGFLVIERLSGTLTIQIQSGGRDDKPQFDTYEILDTIEFSSQRKRMSVVVKFPDKRICVISKGADSIMMQLLRLSGLANQKNVEIQRRVSRRKEVEAQEAIARRSEAYDALSPTSPGRASIALHRISLADVGRSSFSGPRLQPLRDQVDSWLTEREREIDASTLDDDAYSPRPSHQAGRPSFAGSEIRTSHQTDYDFDLVDESLVVDEPAVIERCLQHINDFATEGLRTLLYAYRFLDEDEYTSWKRMYQAATTSIFNRQEMIEKAGEVIERDFELAGATAIEDKLQTGVPEAVDKLRRANIKMWMLTGDKRETAINIGHSCRLIKDYSDVTVLDHEKGEVEEHIEATISTINKGNVAHSVVVVDGQTLSLIEADDYLKALFIDLAVVTDSVICCRASPSQKAGLVKSIRHKVRKSVTLAIGDGANDIAMIQEAHVGIGITGKEGLQAARTSDYSIAQFRFLTKLLLVHGRWNYIRTCKYLLATLWKESTFFIIAAMYQRFTGYTGTSLYEPWSLTMFNTLFTSLPVLFLGIFEKDLASSTLLAVPELYVKGQQSEGFNFRIYLWWIFLAATDATMIFNLMYTLFGRGGTDATSQYNDLFPMSALCFTSIIILVNGKLQLLEMHNVSVTNAVACFASIGGWFVWNVALGESYTGNRVYDVKGAFIHRFGRDLSWWLTLIAILACLFVVEVGARSIKVAWRPSDTDIFQALEKDPKMKRRFEDASALELQAGWAADEVRGVEESAEQEKRREHARGQMEREGEVVELLKARGVSRPEMYVEEVDLADMRRR